MSKFVAGHVTKVWFLKLWIAFLNRNFALKLQGNCWKDDVVTFSAHLSVTIKRLTSYKQKVVLARLQNRPYFCVFKYARAVKQKVWNEAENRELESYARLARVRLLRHALPISLLILRKNPTVLQCKFWPPCWRARVCPPTWRPVEIILCWKTKVP